MMKFRLSLALILFSLFAHSASAFFICPKSRNYINIDKIKIPTHLCHRNDDNFADISTGQNAATISRRLLSFVASIAAFQSLNGGAVASSQYDENYDIITQRLYNKIQYGSSSEITSSKNDFPTSTVIEDLFNQNKNIEKVMSQSVDNLNALNIDEISSSINKNIDQLVQLGSKPFSFDIKFDAETISTVRTTLQELSLDWKIWFVILTLVYASDSLSSVKDINKLNESQKSQIDELFNKLKAYEIEERNYQELEKTTKKSAAEVDKLSSELSARKAELRAMKSSIQKLSELDAQIFSESKLESKKLKSQIDDLTRSAEEEKKSYIESTNAINGKLNEAKSTIESLESQRSALLSTMSNFLVDQQYIPPAMIPDVTPENLPSILLEYRLTPPPREQKKIAALYEENSSVLANQLANAESKIRTLHSKLDVALRKLETTTKQNLEFMSRATETKEKTAKYELELAKLREEVSKATYQLDNSDKFTAESLRLNAIISSLQSSSVAAEDRIRQLESELQLSNSKIIELESQVTAATTATVTIDEEEESFMDVLKRQFLGIQPEKRTAIPATAAATAAGGQDVALGIEEKTTSVITPTTTAPAPSRATTATTLTTPPASSTVVSELLRLSAENKDLKQALAEAESKRLASDEKVSKLAIKLDEMERMMKIGPQPLTGTTGTTTALSESQQRLLSSTSEDELNQVILALSSENDALKLKLKDSESRLWEVRSQMQLKLDAVKAMADELAEEFANSLTVQQQQLQGLDDSYEISSSTSNTKMNSADILNSLKSLSLSQLLSKSKKELEEVLAALGFSRVGNSPLGAMEKRELQDLLLKALSLV